jgi:hypothetical protein
MFAVFPTVVIDPTVLPTDSAILGLGDDKCEKNAQEVNYIVFFVLIKYKIL